MKLKLIRYGLVFFLLACSQTNVPGLVSVPSTEVAFVAPAGFTPLSQQEIGLKFPSKTAPRAAFGNERRTTTVAYDVRDIAVTTEMLEAQLEEISVYSSRAIPGFELMERGIRNLNGRTWAYMEFRSTALDADIRNILLMSAYEGRMIVLNYNSTEADFAMLEPELRASIASIGSGE